MTTIISRVKARSAGLSGRGLLQEIMDEIFKDMPEEFQPEILDTREIKWECDCSRERIEAALATIGSDDLREIIEEDGQAELQCHFCLKKYQFNKDELTEILERLQH